MDYVGYKYYKDCYLTVGRYSYDGSLALEPWNKTDGAITTITKCLGYRRLKENESFVDTNNNPGILSFIKEYNLGTETGGISYSGYCGYPLIKFNIDEINKYVAKKEE